jgi:hypothetical protein
LKVDLAVIVASIASVVLWIEHGHRIDIETPIGAVCPDNENVPYSPDCIVFMRGDGATDMPSRVNAAGAAPAEQSSAPKNGELAVASGAACAGKDNLPYTASCITFMTGWFWRPDTP